MRDRINGESEQNVNRWPQTVRLYDRDAYLRTCTAKVLAVMRELSDNTSVKEAGSGNADVESCDSCAVRFYVILDRTVFFPEGGGQSADTGTLQALPDHETGSSEILSNFTGDHAGAEGAAGRGSTAAESPCTVRVADVQQQAGVIIHTVEIRPGERSGTGEHTEAVRKFLAAFTPGTEVIAEIDFARRFEFMQNHTGEHIMSGLFHSRYGFDNIGFHLSDNTVTLDVNGHLTDEQIYEVEREANGKVWADIPVQVSYPSAQELDTIPYRSKIEIEGQIRIVTIPGVDICACCAPHVAHTGEIGLIKVVKILRYKGGMRLWILCGGRAYEEMQRRQRQVEAVSHLTNRSQDQIAGGVQFLLDEIAGLRQQMKELEYREAFAQLDRIPEGQKNVILFVGEMDSIVQRNLVNRLVEEHEGICGVFSEKEKDSHNYKYILGSRDTDTRLPNKILREKLGARGGGRPEMVQGSVQATEDAVRKILAP